MTITQDALDLTVRDPGSLLYIALGPAGGQDWRPLETCSFEDLTVQAPWWMPTEACMVGEWAVLILLECFLVIAWVRKSFLTHTKNITLVSMGPKIFVLKQMRTVSGSTPYLPIQIFWPYNKSHVLLFSWLDIIFPISLPKLINTSIFMTGRMVNIFSSCPWIPDSCQA